jgi:hypothetical protein
MNDIFLNLLNINDLNMAFRPYGTSGNSRQTVSRNIMSLRDNRACRVCPKEFFAENPPTQSRRDDMFLARQTTGITPQSRRDDMFVAPRKPSVTHKSRRDEMFPASIVYKPVFNSHNKHL